MVPAAEVREKFRRVKPLKEIPVTQRGWTLDALNVVAAVCDRRKLSGAHRAPLQDWKEFNTSDVHAFARDLNHSGAMTWNAFDFTSTSKPA
jgi:hypothetical protein